MINIDIRFIITQIMVDVNMFTYSSPQYYSSFTLKFVHLAFAVAITLCESPLYDY